MTTSEEILDLEFMKEETGEGEGEGLPLYRLEGDYGKELPGIPRDIRARMKERVAFLYGAERVDEVLAEIERLVRVHQAHKSDEVLAAEASPEVTERFTEKDAILITYGDLVTSESRPPLATLADFTNVFFRGLITTLHILPFYPYSSDRGFAVIDFTQVDPAMGTWEDVAALKRGFKLMFDGVFNHVSSKSRWFQDFLAGVKEEQNTFIVFSSRNAIDNDHLGLILRPRTSDLLTEFETINGPRYVWTTFSEDQIDLNVKNPKVLLRLMDVLLFYVRKGADIVRLDAITYLWYELGTSCAHLEQTHEVVRLMRDLLDAAAPGAALITETNVPHADNVTYFGHGDDEAQMVYNFALPPLVLHAFLRGDASVLARWAGELEVPSESTAFFNFLDSHDGIGVMGARGILPEEEIEAMCRKVEEHGGFVSMKSTGDGGEQPYEMNITWFSALNDVGAEEGLDRQVDRFIASRAIALALKGVPGIYLPSFIGKGNDYRAVLADGVKRSINRGTIREDELFARFGDPDSIEAHCARRFTDLLEKRNAEPAFHPAAEQRVVASDPRVLGLLRVARDESSRVLTLVNVSGDAVEVGLDLEELGLPQAPEDLVQGARLEACSGTLSTTLDPYQVLWLR